MITNRQPVTVLRPAMLNDHGTEVPDWSDAERIALRGAVLQPMTGSEQLDHRDTIMTLWLLRAPLGCGLSATDRVEYQGEVYEVVGSPQEWYGPSVLDHLTATLQRWEG